MPEKTSASIFEFPSGDVTQTFKSWTSLWSQWMGQFGFININLAKSSDPALERRIIENVAGYGKQLGRVIEVLDALLVNSATAGWSADQKKALVDFLEMAKEITARGAKIIYTGDDYAGNTGPIMSPRHFRQLLYPGLCRVMGGYKELGLYVIKHTDGNLWPILDMIVDSGIDCLDPIDPQAGMLRLVFGLAATPVGLTPTPTVATIALLAPSITETLLPRAFAT